MINPLRLKELSDVSLNLCVENAKGGIPHKRLGTPEEVAELVTFLLTSKAQYINGEVVRIDGGFTNTKSDILTF